MDSFQYERTELDVKIGPESQLREDLADAMKDCAAVPVSHDSGKRKSFQLNSIPAFPFICGSVFL
jgi:hypothetical protein